MPPKVRLPKKVSLRNVGKKPSVRNGRNAESKIELHHILVGLLVIVAIIAFIYYMTRPSQKLIMNESFSIQGDLSNALRTIKHPYTGIYNNEFFYYFVPISKLVNYTFPGEAGKTYTIILSGNGARGHRKRKFTGGGGGGGGGVMIYTFKCTASKPRFVYDRSSNMISFVVGANGYKSENKVIEGASPSATTGFHVQVPNGTTTDGPYGGLGGNFSEISSTTSSSPKVFAVTPSAGNDATASYTLPSYKVYSSNQLEPTFSDTEVDKLYLFDGGNGGAGGKGSAFKSPNGRNGIPAAILSTDGDDTHLFVVGKGGKGGKGGPMAGNGSSGQTGGLFFYTKGLYTVA